MRRGEATVDSARLWHALDRALPHLREARRDLQEAGCEVLAELLGGVIYAVEAVHREAEKEVVEGLGVGVEELSGRREREAK